MPASRVAQGERTDEVFFRKGRMLAIGGQIDPEEHQSASDRSDGSSRRTRR